MSERLHMPDALRNLNINARKLAAVPLAAVLSLTMVACETPEAGMGEFTCYVPSAGGINGDNKDTALGDKPQPDVDLAANLRHYYGGRATDDNHNGTIEYEEIKNAARRNPVKVLIAGVGIRFIKDTGGDFKNARPGRMDVSMGSLAACRDFMRGGRKRQYAILPDTPVATP